MITIILCLEPNSLLWKVITGHMITIILCLEPISLLWKGITGHMREMLSLYSRLRTTAIDVEIRSVHLFIHYVNWFIDSLFHFFTSLLVYWPIGPFNSVLFHWSINYLINSFVHWFCNTFYSFIKLFV